MPRFPLTVFLFGLLVAASVASAQETKSGAPSTKEQQDAAIKKDADAEAELQKVIARSGNDRAALVRNLKGYLERFPDAPRKAGVYRALVEFCQQLQDIACALDYAERLVAV